MYSTNSDKDIKTLAQEPNKKGWLAGHFIMIRNFKLADAATFANMACGMESIFFAIRYINNHDQSKIFWAIAFIIFGLGFDIVDGPIARLRNTASPLGRELDSFADALSFGIAPAIIAYALGFNTTLDGIALIIFVACCISRLSRFNVTSDEFSFGGPKVKLILGLPTAWSLLPTGALLYALWMGYLPILMKLGLLQMGTEILHTPVLFYPFIGLLMISETIRFNRPFTD